MIFADYRMKVFDYRRFEVLTIWPCRRSQPTVAAMQTSFVQPSAMPLVRGATDVIFTVANPVAQAKAPEVLNRVFARLGVDAVVVPVKADDAHFEAFLRGVLGAQNVRGMLVSIPHKTRLMALLDHPDADALRAGSANAVRADADGLLEGALFDGRGFVNALNHHGVKFADRRVQLVGAGGAGLAIASALVFDEGPPAELTICDTDRARASHLAQRLQKLSRSSSALRCAVQHVGHCDPRGFDLMINATPLGMNARDPLPFDPASIERKATVVDILMKDRPTALERACQDIGIVVFPGHEMLVQQVPDYLDFFGFAHQAQMLRQGQHPVMQELRQSLMGDRTKF
jgi:shikimate dehydrogenase